MTEQQLPTITPGLMALAQHVLKFKAEYESRLIGEVITVEINDVDEDGRAYCTNPAGFAEYPFVNELQNIRVED